MPSDAAWSLSDINLSFSVFILYKSAYFAATVLHV
jgi:hypothetical protein